MSATDGISVQLSWLVVAVEKHPFACNGRFQMQADYAQTAGVFSERLSHRATPQSIPGEAEKSPSRFLHFASAEIRRVTLQEL